MPGTTSAAEYGGIFHSVYLGLPAPVRSELVYPCKQ